MAFLGINVVKMNKIFKKCNKNAWLMKIFIVLCDFSSSIVL